MSSFLEWIWYSWKLYELSMVNWETIKKELIFKDKNWKEITISEFNIKFNKILIVDLENNFYLFDNDKLIFSWKRDWRWDIELFEISWWIKDIFDENILND